MNHTICLLTFMTGIMLTMHKKSRYFEEMLMKIYYGLHVQTFSNLCCKETLTKGNLVLLYYVIFITGITNQVKKTMPVADTLSTIFCHFFRTVLGFTKYDNSSVRYLNQFCLHTTKFQKLLHYTIFRFFFSERLKCTSRGQVKFRSDYCRIPMRDIK